MSFSLLIASLSILNVNSFTPTVPLHIQRKYAMQNTDIPYEEIPVDTCFSTGVQQNHLEKYPFGDIWLAYYGNTPEESNRDVNIAKSRDLTEPRATAPKNGCGFAFYAVKAELHLLYLVYLNTFREMNSDVLKKGKKLAKFLIDYVDKDPPYVHDTYSNAKISHDVLKWAILEVIYPDEEWNGFGYSSDPALDALKKKMTTKFKNGGPYKNPDYPLTYFICQYIASMLDLHGWARKSEVSKVHSNDEIFICPNQINTLLTLDCPQNKCSRGDKTLVALIKKGNDFCEKTAVVPECKIPQSTSKAKIYHNNMMNNINYKTEREYDAGYFPQYSMSGAYGYGYNNYANYGNWTIYIICAISGCFFMATICFVCLIISYVLGLLTNKITTFFTPNGSNKINDDYTEV